MSVPYYPQFVRGLAFPVMKTAEFDTTYQSAPNKYAVTIINTINPFWHWTLQYNYLKDNPKDVVAIYSPWTDYQIMQGFFLQNSGQGSYFLLTDPGTALGSPDNYLGPALQNQVWQANRTYLLGAIVLDAQTGGHAQQVVSAGGGISAWTAPSWNHSSGTTTESTALVWQDLGAASGTYPNPNAQLQLVTDGTYYYSPLQRNFGGEFLEDITDLNQITTLGGSTFALYDNGTLQTYGTGAGDYTIAGPGLSIPGYSYMGLYVRWSSGHVPTGPITAQFNFFFRARFESDEFDFEQYLATTWTVGGDDAKNGTGYVKLQSARPNPL